MLPETQNRLLSEKRKGSYFVTAIKQKHKGPSNHKATPPAGPLRWPLPLMPLALTTDFSFFPPRVEVTQNIDALCGFCPEHWSLYPSETIMSLNSLYLFTALETLLPTFLSAVMSSLHCVLLFHFKRCMCKASGGQIHGLPAHQLYWEQYLANEEIIRKYWLKEQMSE